MPCQPLPDDGPQIVIDTATGEIFKRGEVWRGILASISKPTPAKLPDEEEGRRDLLTALDLNPESEAADSEIDVYKMPRKQFVAQILAKQAERSAYWRAKQQREKGLVGTQTVAGEGLTIEGNGTQIAQINTD